VIQAQMTELPAARGCHSDRSPVERKDPYIGDGRQPRVVEAPPRNSIVVPMIVAAIVLVAAVAAAWFLWWRDATSAVSPPRASVPASPPPPVAQAPRNPIEAAEPEKPLPSLKESDGPVAAALAALVGQDAFGRFFVPENLIRNIVATVDNLPREQVSQRVDPLRPVAGVLATNGKDGSRTLAPANASRYALQMGLVETVPTESIVAFYRRHYPLFQQAYVELGYPNGYFNDRLVEVIDHLLATPEPTGPIRLTQPKVLYEFADPALEDLSAGQKMMLRLGRQNRDVVKAKLREIRAAIVAR
jgi:hypothetical protein